MLVQLLLLLGYLSIASIVSFSFLLKFRCFLFELLLLILLFAEIFKNCLVKARGEHVSVLRFRARGFLFFLALLLLLNQLRALGLLEHLLFLIKVLLCCAQRYFDGSIVVRVGTFVGLAHFLFIKQLLTLTFNQNH